MDGQYRVFAWNSRRLFLNAPSLKPLKFTACEVGSGDRQLSRTFDWSFPSAQRFQDFRKHMIGDRWNTAGSGHAHQPKNAKITENNILPDRGCFPFYSRGKLVNIGLEIYEMKKLDVTNFRMNIGRARKGNFGKAALFSGRGSNVSIERGVAGLTTSEIGIYATSGKRTAVSMQIQA